VRVRMRKGVRVRRLMLMRFRGDVLNGMGKERDGVRTVFSLNLMDTAQFPRRSPENLDRISSVYFLYSLNWKMDHSGRDVVVH